MPSLLVTGTTQALCLGAVSNLLAQVIQAQQENRSFSFDKSTFLFFLTWTLVSCPANILFQVALEDAFPGSKPDPNNPGKTALNKTNTVKKFLIDQTLSASANTAGYVAALSAFRGNGSIMQDVQQDFWPLMQAGWKVWPFVSLLNFTVVPLERRTLVGSLFGLVWGIYMSMLAAQ